MSNVAYVTMFLLSTCIQVFYNNLAHFPVVLDFLKRSMSNNLTIHSQFFFKFVLYVAT